MPVAKPRMLIKHKMATEPPEIGQVFAMEFAGKGFLFGRVIAGPLDMEWNKPGAPWRDHKWVVYIYRGFGQSIDDEPPITPDRMILPPAIVLGWAWRSGYWFMVRDQELKPEDRLPVHCFKSTLNYDTYWDENRKRLPGPSDPVVDWTFGHHVTVENDIIRKLRLKPEKSE